MRWRWHGLCAGPGRWAGAAEVTTHWWHLFERCAKETVATPAKRATGAARLSRGRSHAGGGWGKASLWSDIPWGSLAGAKHRRWSWPRLQQGGTLPAPLEGGAKLKGPVIPRLKDTRSGVFPPCFRLPPLLCSFCFRFRRALPLPPASARRKAEAGFRLPLPPPLPPGLPLPLPRDPPTHYSAATPRSTLASGCRVSGCLVSW